MLLKEDRLFVNDTSPIPYQASPNKGGLLADHKFIVIHYTEGQSAVGAVEWLTNPASQVSAHLVIGRDGSTTQLVPFSTIAWHAGTSTWEGFTKLNRYSIGIELDNAGRMSRKANKWMSGFGKVYPDDQVIAAVHKFGKRQYGWHTFTPGQIQATVDICKLLVATYDFKEIVGHDDIAPQRKWDPGPAFPMDDVRKRVFGQP